MTKKYKIKCCEGIHPRINVSNDFIKKNKFKLERTQAEILEKISSNDDFWGNKQEVLMDFLEWKNSKQFYKDIFVKKVNNGEESEIKAITDIKEAVQDMLDYLIFGYMKSLDERGISSSRTIEKLSAWFWILGRNDLHELVEDDELYNPYGMPALIAVSEQMGLKAPKDCIAFSKKKCE